MTIAFRVTGIRIAGLVATVFAALLIGACTQEGQTPGESPPKRTLDPRSEAVRYFPAGMDAIALLDTADPEAMASLNQQMSDVPAWSAIRGRIAGSLEGAGIDPDEILALSRNPADDIELPDPEIAFGTVPGSGPEADRALLALATEQGVELDSIFKQAAESGQLEAAGEFDGARLYRGPDLDFAVRDGVLIAAPDINRLQQAITRRDGDREAQLDDAPITALLNQLPENGVLRAYSGPREASEALLALVAGAIAESETGTGGDEAGGGPDSDDERSEGGATGGSGQAGEEPTDSTDDADQATERELPTAAESAISVRGRDGRLAIDLVVKIEQPKQLAEDAPEEEPAPDEEPAPIAIAPEQIEAVLAGLPPDAVLRRLSRVGPLAGAAWIEGDLLRARLITAP